MYPFLLLLFGLFLGFVSPLWATTYYISPTGSDASADPTSSATPWKTWAHAIPLLNPGDTLIARNGDYTFAASGTFRADCSTTASDGTSTQRITVIAENERQAWIHGDGTLSPFKMTNCDYWTVQGFRVSSMDNASSPASQPNIWIVGGSNLIYRRNIADHNNRYVNASCYAMTTVTDSLFEENEAYYCHRNVMSAGSGSLRNTFRRNYINSRDYADIPGGYGPTNFITRGDGGFTCYPCSDSLWENNISEGNGNAFEVQAPHSAPAGNKYYGNVALANNNGLFLNARGATQAQMAVDTEAFHHVSVDSIDSGVRLRAAKNLTSTKRHCTNCTSINSKKGFMSEDGSGPDWDGDGNNNFYLTNVLAINNSDTGFFVTLTPTWNINFPHADANVTDYNPASTNANYANVYTPLSTDPQYGTCYLWPPDGSPMINAGVGGNTNIGATVLYRYANGVPTSEPLWDTTTGAFPCGATINSATAPALDTTTDGCTTVHTRLRVNTGGCSFPSGYGSAELPVVTIAANDTTASEAGPDNGQFTITRAGSTAGALDVSFTLGGAATSTVDYTSGNTTLRTIPDGSTTQTITVVPIADAEIEAGGETVSVQLVSGSGYTLGTPDNAQLTIADGVVLSYPRVLSGIIAR